MFSIPIYIFCVKNGNTLPPNGKVTYVEINDGDPNKFGFKQKHNLLPYPGVEIRLNPNITQNPGW